MNRQPLVGYNHSLPYQGRTYHVQTEDSGLARPHIYSHLFFQGMILSSAKSEYAPELEAAAVRQLMQDQHKGLMKRLVRGELDGRIRELLGDVVSTTQELPAVARPRRVQSYQHQLTYAGRVYAIQTYFNASVETDVFHEQVLIVARLQDFRDVLPAGGEEIKQRAQEQHKALMRELRNGGLDGRIRELLGTLAPQEQRRPRPAPRRTEPLEEFRHRLQRGAYKVDVRTQLLPPQTPHVITEIFSAERLVSAAEFFSYQEVVEDPDAVEFAREVARHQHTEVLKQVARGKYDELLHYVLGDGFLDAQVTNKVAAKT